MKEYEAILEIMATTVFMVEYSVLLFSICVLTFLSFFSEFLSDYSNSAQCSIRQTAPNALTLTLTTQALPFK